MMIFMLVAVVFMLKVEADSKAADILRDQVKEKAKETEKQKKKMEDLASLYLNMKTKLYERLLQEFSKNRDQWHLDIKPDLAIEFREPDVLFESQKFELRDAFKDILKDFFPRYLNILDGQEFKDSIEEIRIEGHTSSKWKDMPLDEAYLKNMELSQARTRAVLEYVLLELPRSPDAQRWLKGHLTANGLSSSKLHVKLDGTEDPEASRRVEFRVRTNAERLIEKVLEAARPQPMPRAVNPEQSKKPVRP